jgi:hypothetical protein
MTNQQQGRLRCVLFRASGNAPEWVDVVWEDDDMLDVVTDLLGCNECVNFQIAGDVAALLDERSLLKPDSLPLNENFSNFFGPTARKINFRGNFLLLAETEHLSFRDIVPADLEALAVAISKE